MERKMRIKALLLTAIAAAMLTATGASAEDWNHRDRDHYGYRQDGDRGMRDRDDWRGREAWHWRDDRGGWHGDHDRYWRAGWREGRYVDRDRFYVELRRHGYYRWSGEPYWYHGRYVIRSYDRFGRAVFVEVNPYTGGFVGVVSFQN